MIVTKNTVFQAVEDVGDLSQAITDTPQIMESQKEAATLHGGQQKQQTPVIARDNQFGGCSSVSKQKTHRTQTR